jgi:hypothetical protein
MEQTQDLQTLMQHLVEAGNVIKHYADAPESATLDDLFMLSGLMHFVGCTLGTLMNAFPNDAWLEGLMEQCTSIVKSLDELTQLAQARRDGGSIH